MADLNEHFAEAAREIKSHGGMINKFIGDGIMALFGAPVAHADDARRGVACALRMIELNQEFNRRRATEHLEPLVMGIGIHTGEAVVGNIGAPEKMEYTAIGTAVNVASRIEGQNKPFDSQILISEATCHLVQDFFEVELAGQAALKGITEPVALYKVTGLR